MSLPSSITKLVTLGKSLVERAPQPLRRAVWWARSGLTSGDALLLAERDRWMFWVPVAMALGIGAYFSLPQEPELWQAGIGLLIFIGLALAVDRLEATSSYWLLLSRVLFCVALGFFAAKWRTDRVDAPVLERDARAVSIEGRIVGMIGGNDGFPRYIIEPSMISRLNKEQVPKRIRVSYRGKGEQLPPGTSVRIRASLMPPPTPAVPHGFDFARQSFFKRIGAVGYMVSNFEVLENQKAHSPMASLSAWVARKRAGLGARIKEALPGEQGGVAAALIVGDRSGIPPDRVEALREAGLAHLLAISGLHMGMAGWAIFALVRMGFAGVPVLALRYPSKKIAAFVGLIGAATYLVISGAPISAQRAFIMLGLVFVAVLLDRPAFTLRMVALAATIILLLQPESLLQAGFQMSFAACTVLVSGYEARRKWLRGRRKVGGFVMGFGAPRGLWHWTGARATRYLGGILLTSFLAGLATAPFAAFHFNQFANYGLAGNLFAVPMMGTLVMPWAVMGLLLMPLGLESIPFAVMGFGIDQVLWVAEEVSSKPYAVTPIPSWSLSALVTLVLGALWVLLWSKRWRLAGFGVVTAGLLMGLMTPRPDIIIGREGKNIAIRTDEGMLDVMKMRRKNYAVQTWERRAGLSTEADAPKGEVSPYNCDKLGCLYRLTNGQVLIHVADARAFEEDCAIADVIITNLWVPKWCDDPSLVVGMMDVRRGGAHIVSILEDGYAVTTSASVRGQRPWATGG